MTPLVGAPRSQLALIVGANAEKYAEILQVKPGLTALVQVSGPNAPGDVGILLKTRRVVLVGEGQMNDQSREDAER